MASIGMYLNCVSNSSLYVIISPKYSVSTSIRAPSFVEGQVFKHLRFLFLSVLSLFLIVFILAVANQTIQFVASATTINPNLGKFVLVLLLCVYSLLIATPVALFLTLPKALQVPLSKDDPEFAVYLEQLRTRLSRNTYLAGYSFDLSNQHGIENAIKVLNVKADEVIQSTAKTVFVSTAVSQSGRLDAFVVLIALSRMVWQVAHIYNQRPALGEMYQLYANIAGTVLLSSEIEDLDVTEQLEALVGLAAPSAAVGWIPVVGAFAGLFANMVLEGGANAFLTLRVGAITKLYCGSVIKLEMSFVRRSASVQASRLLLTVVLESARTLGAKMTLSFRKSATSDVKPGSDKGSERTKGKTAGLSSRFPRRLPSVRGFFSKKKEGEAPS